jgi:cytochrome c biogenesis protein
LGPLKEELSQDITIETLLSKSKFKDQFRSTASSMQTAEQVRRWLKARKLNYSESVVTLKQQDLSTVLFMAGKHRFQRWGDFILHISIVIILAGNLMGAMFGFEEILPIPEGGSVKMTNRPFEVFLKKFDIDYYKTTGAPSLYASDLLVRQNDKVIAEKRIIVNEPLDIDRVRFYQASWGMTYDFKSAMFRIAGLDLVLPPKEIIPVPGTPLSIRANQFLPSFTLDPDGRATTMNFEGQNPALQIDFLEKGKVQVQLWILKNHPDVVYRIKDDKLTRTAPPPFQLIDVEPILFSGVQVGYDPGAPLFWFGAVILLFGLCIHFYMHQRRLRILIIPKGPQTEVVVGGWNSLTPEDFSQEFRNWVTDIRRSVEHGGV